MATRRNELSAGILVVDDLAYVGERENRVGPLMRDYLEDHGYLSRRLEVVPIDRDLIISTLTKWVYRDRYHLILVSGGVGLAPLDVTPEAVLDIVERRLPGMEDALRRALEKNESEAMLFRGVAGTLGNSLIIVVPDEPKSAEACLRLLEPAIHHALDLIGGEKLQ